MKITPTTLTTPDGFTFARCDVSSHIEYVTVPWDHFIRGHLEKGEAVLITGILAPSKRLVSPTRDLGEIRFTTNYQTRLVAPVTAMQNRYHRLMLLEGLRGRFQLLFDPESSMRVVNPDEDLRPLLNPVHVPELIEYEITHQAPEGADDGKPILVEFQYLLLRRGYSSSALQLWRPR
jgi:hypothetical protein